MVRSHKVGVTPTTVSAIPLVIVFCLVIFGLLMVYDASSAQALQSFGDKYYFVREQIKWVILGAIAGVAAFSFDYRQLRNLALPILISAIVLLLAVFLPGLGVRAYGAHRWISLGFTVLQPSEWAKLALTIYLSTWLTNKEKGRLFPFLLLTSLVVGLIMFQPDMGTAVVLLSVSLIIYFLSESQIMGLVFLFPLVAIGAAVLAVKSSYRLKRVMSFFDPNIDPLGASYHIRQILIALGSGGLFGLGLGNSRQKYSYLPEATTDSIFAIIAEELGFIGAFLLIGAFAVFFYLAVKNTASIEDKFARLLGMGIISYLAVQTVINLASMVALIPLTGVPLPFISYGGSALVVELVGVGILANIWRQHLSR